MTDPGVEEMDAWANRHPRAARTLIVASIWAVLHGVALFLGWLGLGIFGGLFSGIANLLAIGWAVVLVYLNWDRVAPAIERAKEWFHVTVSRRTLRSYRYEGERSAHEEQARETTISLGLMAQAAADDPTQARMATEIEHGAESRLEVLLSKPRLTIIEKGERDAIQAHLQARRQSFEPAALWTPEPAPARIQGFLSPIPGFSFPFSWALAAVLAVVGLVQTVRVERVKDDARDTRDALEQVATERDALQTQANMDRAAFDALQAENHVTRELAESVRARQERTEARIRRSQNEQLEAARGGRPVDLDGRLRDFTVQPFAAAGGDPGAAGDPAGGVPGRAPGALDLSTPDALPADHDGTGAGDSNVEG